MPEQLRIQWARRPWRRVLIAAMAIGIMLMAGCSDGTTETPGQGERASPVMSAVSSPSVAEPTVDVQPIPTAGQPASPSATSSGAPTDEPASSPSFSVEQLFEWVELDSPTFLDEVPDGTGRLVVLEQSGIALSFLPTPMTEGAEPETFLDIQDRVNRGGNEEGLLGLAFHPDYDENGRLFVYYSAGSPRRSVVSEFRASPGGYVQPESERVILEVGQPYSNHNGGMLAFGPDRYLYIGLGDGGSGGDPHGNGQDPHTLLGSILRMDVDSGEPYTVPRDNPFADGVDGAPEVWAYGFRNPWRFAFDPDDGALWVADVGQNRFEEVSIAKAGANYGWNITEGPSCYQAPSCERDGLEPPVAWYGHDQGCSVTGGYVNRDPATPALNGLFVLADYCSGTVWRVDGVNSDGLVELVDSSLNISSFGESLDGALYLVSAGDRPGIYRLVQVN